MENSGHDVPNFSLGFQAAENSAFDISREERPMETEDIEECETNQHVILGRIQQACTSSSVAFQKKEYKYEVYAVPFLHLVPYKFDSKPASRR